MPIVCIEYIIVNLLYYFLKGKLKRNKEPYFFSFSFLEKGKQMRTRREEKGEEKGNPNKVQECRGQTIRDIASDPDNELDRRHFPPPRSPAHNDSRRPSPSQLSLVPNRI
ncbi:hypothetical protein CDAR_278581 [Caerostris darwini]|uniref:Ycf1 n=1 Tax=Caerostris darwini TaxID=1538125 RepID=A0AAV4WNK7_9ARAC|nr:hypothetical protein CDAR_278581 [Caerostris darwini]